MKKAKYNQNSAIRGALRRAFARSPLVREKMEESRREVPRYKKDGSLAKKPAVQRQCEVCCQWVGSTKIVIDHIDPVIPLTGAQVREDGSQDWNDFIDRLWCSKANLQRICDVCHRKKTNEERLIRTMPLKVAELSACESPYADVKAIKKWLNKFNPKTLPQYPQDFQQRVLKLKERVKGRKTAKH